MKKKLWIIVAIVVVIAAIAFAFHPHHGAENPDGKPVVKIGAILPLTGGAAEIGSAVLNGAKLAIAEINADAGNKYFYQLIVEDIGQDAKKAPAIYAKMRDIDGVSAITTSNSATGLVLRDMATHDKILNLSPATNQDIADKKFNYIYSYDIDETFKTLTEHLKKRGMKTIAVATTTTEASSYLIPFLEKHLKSVGIKIAHKTGFMPDERDFKINAAKIIKSNPDIVFLYANEPGLSLFAEQLRQTGYAGPMTTSLMFPYGANPELFEGQEFVDYALGCTGDFVQRYSDKFGTAPKSVAAGQYDNIMLMHLMAEKFGMWSEWDASDVEPRLKEVIKGYSGANGQLHINSHGIIYSAPVMKVMKNGQPVPVKE